MTARKVFMFKYIVFFHFQNAEGAGFADCSDFTSKEAITTPKQRLAVANYLAQKFSYDHVVVTEFRPSEA